MKRLCLYALCFLFVGLLSGCDITRTTTNSDKNTNLSADEDLAPVVVRGSSKLYVQGYGVYINDDGLQQISVPAGQSGDAKAILHRLDTYALETNPEQLSIKQVTISVQGSQVTLIGGSGLKLHSNTLNIATSTSGNDLIIAAKPEKIGASYYLLISNTNPENYMIQNDQDRYAPGIFMIAKNTYTLIKLQRNNQLSYSYKLRYPASGFDYPLSDYQPMSAIPYQTPLKLTFPYLGDEPRLKAYQVSFTDKQTNANQTFYDTIAKEYSAGIKDDLSVKLQGRFIEGVAPLVANKSGEYLFAASNASKQGIILVTPAYVHLIERSTVPFAASLKKVGTMHFPTENFPYQMEIETQYDLDFGALEASLQKILGTGGYMVGGTRHGFIYKIQPKKIYSGDLQVKTIFGQITTVPLNLSIDEIAPQVITKQILSNSTVSILPNDGSFQDILIQSENINNFQVQFSACAFNAQANLGQSLGQGLENYMFSCDKQQYAGDVMIPQFQYRKVYRTPVKLPGNFPKTGVFRASLQSSTGAIIQSHYFIKSDIGIRTKVAGDQLHIRGFTLRDNASVTSGSLTITTLSGVLVTGMQIHSTKTTISLPKDKNGDIKNDILMVSLSNGSSSGFVLVHPRGNSDYYAEQSQRSYTLNSFLNPADVLASNNNISFWGSDYPVKVYGYTDRGLYKAGDMVYFAGFVRDLRLFTGLNYLTNKKVSIEARDPQGNGLYSNSGIILDEFGGFKGSFMIPSTLALGDMILSYQLVGDERAAYSHNISVQEYQKPTFFADITHEEKDSLNLVISPRYFFGSPLKNYDVKVDRSLVGKDVCAYCRWRNQEPYYYNFVFNDTISTGGSFTLFGQTNQTISYSLFDTKVLTQKGYQYTLKASVIIKDNVSDETQFITKYIDFQPEVKLGLSGQPYDWLYHNDTKDERKTYKIEGEVAAGKNAISRLNYEVYFWSYDQQTQQGPDGNQYYVNGNQYRMIRSGSIGSRNGFTVHTDFIDKPGSYLVRVYANDENNNIIGEVQKQVEYYEFIQGSEDLLGALPNNYTLTVDVPKKIYEEAELIPVNIAPYQQGARVVMTVERGDRIVETIEKTLDGSPLTVVVKKGYAPNIVINVMQLIGTDKATSTRKEPRFLVGFGQAEISTAMHELNIDIQTDKQTYKPGEQVKMTIFTKDSKGNLIDARISVGVLDQALLSLYDAIREPIPYFFNKLGTSIFNYTNMKLLYQSLRAFANNGSKGGGGNGGKAMFSVIRDDLEDVAFWRGGIVTTGGKAEISFTLPENLTTWVIDLIGITKDTRLGTARKTFTVAKDLIIEANPPSFVTIGDSLKVPVKLLVPAGGDQSIQGSAFIENSSGDKIDLGKFSAKPNSKIIIDLKVPQNRLSSPYVKLSVQGGYGSVTDGSVSVIPLRTEGLVMKDSVGVISSAGEHLFQLPANLGGTLRLSLSQFPTNLIDPVVSYLVGYPYGCTEQTLSAILPLSLVTELVASGKFKSKFVHGDEVVMANGTSSIATMLNDGIVSLLAHQQANGSFGRWNSNEDSNTAQKYALSAYTYGSLLLLKDKAQSQGSISQALKSAEGYLRANRKLSTEGFLYYLSQKAQAGVALTKDEINEMNSLKPQSLPYGGLLRYIIAVFQGNKDDSVLRKTYATIPTNQDQRTENSIFLNQTTAHALKLQALAKDPSATQAERMESLQSLLSLRDKNGLRGRSTQANVQALRAIAQLSKVQESKETISCDVTIGGKQQKVTVGTGMVMIEQQLEGNRHYIKRSCNGTLMADASASFVPKSLDDILGADAHVTQMTYSLSDGAIGEVKDLSASRSTTVPGEQVAVEIFIPSTYKLFDTIASKNNNSAFSSAYSPVNIQTSTLPFAVSDPNCMPSHWETRFDRLFLYYDTLPAVTCDITTQVLKAYEGTPTIMPMRVYEMYKGVINGRKIIKR